MEQRQENESQPTNAYMDWEKKWVAALALVFANGPKARIGVCDFSPPQYLRFSLPSAKASVGLFNQER